MCKFGRRPNACHPHWHAPPSRQHLHVSCRLPSRRVSMTRDLANTDSFLSWTASFIKQLPKQRQSNAKPGPPPRTRRSFVWYLQRYFGHIADPSLIVTSIVVSRVEKANRTVIAYQLLANADGLVLTVYSHRLVGERREGREIPPHQASSWGKKLHQVACLGEPTAVDMPRGAASIPPRRHA